MNPRNSARLPHHLALAAVAILSIIPMIWVFAKFFVPITLAGIGCALTHWPYRQLKRILSTWYVKYPRVTIKLINRPPLSLTWHKAYPFQATWIPATIMLLVMIGIVVLPLVVFYDYASESIIAWAQEAVLVGSDPASFTNLAVSRLKETPGVLPSVLYDYLQEQATDFSFANLGDSLIQTLVGLTTVILREAKSLATNTFVFMMILFFSYESGPTALRLIRQCILPIDEKDAEMLYKSAVRTTKAVLYGTVLIGLIQTIFNGMTLAIIGVPMWGLLTGAMLLLSITPIGGTFVMFLTAIGLAFGSSDWSSALIVSIVGVLVGTIDNLFRPIFVGQQTDVPASAIFVATILGILTIGAMGFIYGPVVLVIAKVTFEFIQRDQQTI